MNLAEREIFIDALLIDDHFVANIDEAMSHFETRGEIAKQIGEAIAKKLDQNVLQVGVLTARASATVSGLPGGAQKTNAAAKTDSDVLYSLIADAAQTLDENDVPEEDRYTAIKPAQYWLLAQNTKVLNKDWTQDNGDYAKGIVKMAAGTGLVKTNNLPTTSIAQESGVHASNTYHGDFSATAALVWHPRAMGTVKLIAMKMEKEYKMDRQGTLIVGSQATGTGILRPECAVELATS